MTSFFEKLVKSACRNRHGSVMQTCPVEGNNGIVGVGILILRLGQADFCALKVVENVVLEIALGLFGVVVRLDLLDAVAHVARRKSTDASELSQRDRV